LLIAALSALGLGLAGCQSAQVAAAPDTDTASSPATELHDPQNVVTPPESNVTPTDLAIYKKTGFVTVGSDPASAFKLVRGASDTGFESEKLPPHFAAPYRAEVWEGGDDESFGVLTIKDKIVQATDELKNVSPETVQQVVQDTEDRFNAVGTQDKVDGKKVHYYFWEASGQRLMICAVQDPAGHILLTQAVGVVAAMNALKMDPTDARDAQRRVDATPATLASPTAPS
jgi:hypothetical protein